MNIVKKRLFDRVCRNQGFKDLVDFANSYSRRNNRVDEQSEHSRLTVNNRIKKSNLFGKNFKKTDL
jgi:hypothetical protein